MYQIINPKIYQMKIPKNRENINIDLQEFFFLVLLLNKNNTFSFNNKWKLFFN